MTTLHHYQRNPALKQPLCYCHWLIMVAVQQAGSISLTGFFLEVVEAVRAIYRPDLESLHSFQMMKLVITKI